MANAKGGSAKTTTAVHVAAGLAATGVRVLLADLDTQGHASVWLAGMEARRGPGLADALHARTVHPDHLRVVPGRPGLELLAGGPALGPAELALAKRPDGLLALRELLLPHRRRWAVVVLDTPPHVGGPLVLAALMAADAVLAPFVPGFLPLDGLGQLEERLRAARDLGSKARLAGFLAVAVDSREGVADDALELVRREAPGLLLRHVVRVSTAAKTLPARQALAMDAGEDLRGAEDWPAVVREVERRLQGLNE